MSGKSIILLDLLGVHGYSGSPVIVEKTEEVIGVIWCGPVGTDITKDFSFATPITQEDYEKAMNADADSK